MLRYRKLEPGDGTSVVMLGETRISTDQIVHELNRIDDLEREVIAWRDRFPDLALINRLDGIQPKG